ncbi:hypothetical protein AB0H34_05280 [Saccharopolyspora shandongensis]|uniref:hypothetical protein n=1 Tax=Saccharopolyspora shandongensis TaxID=418495 RepID=UPI0033FC311A
MAAVAYRIPSLLQQHEAALGPVVQELALAGIPGAAGIAGFAAAARSSIAPTSTCL